MKTERAHLFIGGRVQGVFYRAFTREVALRLRLTGWVKNLNDGRVEAVLEGSKQLVEEAIQECRRGPRGSVVNSVDVRWKEASSEFTGFDIRH